MRPQGAAVGAIILAFVLAGCGAAASNSPVVTATPTSTRTPIATPTPHLTPTVLPTATSATATPATASAPATTHGALLCSSTWSTGMDGWTGTNDWKALNEQLLDDGTNGSGNALSPCTPQTANYSVQVTMQVTRTNCCDATFGIRLRTDDSSNGGYSVGYSYDDGALEIWNGGTSLASVPFGVGTHAHTFRVELWGNTIRVYVDSGGPVIQAEDSQYLDAGRVGVWSDNTELSTANFQVRALSPNPPSVTTASCGSTWSNGFDGWIGSGDWSWSNGSLLDDGTNGSGSALSPCRPSSPNYTVQIALQVNRSNCCDATFGIHIRTDENGSGGYGIGFSYNDGSIEIWNGSTSLASAHFDPGTKSHTYRVTIDGNAIKVSVDGNVVLQATDNQYLNAGRIGLWSDNTSLSARGFQVNST